MDAAKYCKPTSSTLSKRHFERPLKWTDYADVWLNFPLGSVLDYGCGEGEFAERIRDRLHAYHGVDIDGDKVEKARARGWANVQRINPRDPLPFGDESFDTVVILEVIEHVSDEALVLGELARVLRQRGRLLLTTPHRGLLTFLDPGNFKFVLPRLHRFVHCGILRQSDYYEQRFGGTRRREQNMVADFATDQTPWHRHYSYQEIRRLAPPGLSTLAWSVYFPMFRALWSLRLALKTATFGRYPDLPPPLRQLYRRLSRSEGQWGDQLVVLFEKQ